MTSQPTKKRYTTVPLTRTSARISSSSSMMLALDGPASVLAKSSREDRVLITRPRLGVRHALEALSRLRAALVCARTETEEEPNPFTGLRQNASILTKPARRPSRASVVVPRCELLLVILVVVSPSFHKKETRMSRISCSKNTSQSSENLKARLIQNLTSMDRWPRVD